ncbi:hypothetical protein Csa_007126 [Cucumis sativus]|uniref:Uncharacterized protein n=1 Tax=Cucumis sativus TaxID=3659 RepID=A0A0A0M357_CUCSA|nr:hypothetical protein Csa_007126 [Cucumis sativus]
MEKLGQSRMSYLKEKTRDKRSSGNFTSGKRSSLLLEPFVITSFSLDRRTLFSLPLHINRNTRRNNITPSRYALHFSLTLSHRLHQSLCTARLARLGRYSSCGFDLSFCPSSSNFVASPATLTPSHHSSLFWSCIAISLALF